jgi:CheY-like chemotaxis protein/HEAT repeat protein
MNPVLRHVLAGLLMIGVLSHSPSSAWSQDAAAQAPDAAAPVPEAGANNAAEPADAGSAKSPLAIEPKTPEDLFDAILLMVDISRNAVAKKYLKKFLADEPADELLLKLREKYGPAAFLRLANIPELQPDSKALLERNNLAYTKYANDPARLDQFLKDLVSGTAEQQTIARHQMETAGTTVVPALISALGDPKYANSQTTIVEMLVRIGPPAVPALQAALMSPDVATRQAVMLSLGLIRNETSIPYLLRFAGQTPATNEAITAKNAMSRILKNDALVRVQLQNVANRLLKTARDYFLGRHVWELDKDQLVSLWTWDQSIRTVRELHVPPDVAARQEGLFFAKSALQVAPDRTDIQSTYLNLLFAEEIATGGLSKPLKSGPGSMQDLALSLGADAVARALSEAMELRKSDSALVALQILAKIGTVQQVRIRNGKQSAIQRALNYPSRRVQFAAAQAIVSIDPTKSYPGAERVIAILGRALTQAESTEKLAMVLDSVIDRGQTIAGFLNDLGYTPTHRQTGREGFQTAANAQELDLILLDANIQRWALSETLTNLKFDPRTMDVPILIYGEAITERNVRVYIQQFRNVYYIVMPATADDLRRQLGPAIAQQSEPPLTPEERSTKALRAAEMLGFLSSGQRRKQYDFTPIEKHLLTTSENSQLAPFLLSALNALPTISAQRRIAELAASDQQPNEVRSIAARQLVSHIRLYGLLITPDQVELLRAGWGQTTDKILYSELSAVMGILKPNTVLVGQRLRQVPDAPAPGPGPAPAPEGAKEEKSP